MPVKKKQDSDATAAPPSSKKQRVAAEDDNDNEDEDDDAVSMADEEEDDEEFVPAADDVDDSQEAGTDKIKKSSSSTTSRRTPNPGNNKKSKTSNLSDGSGGNDDGRSSAALSIDISDSGMAAGNGDGGGGSSNVKVTTPRPASAIAMDNHPYARGAVIEALHGVKETITSADTGGTGNSEAVTDATATKSSISGFTKEDEDWWNADSDEEENEDEQKEKVATDDKFAPNTSASNGDEEVTVRLCDIIDRVPIPNEPGKFRYYVHYRDFNRRMDEWISMDRIVSPPSVGNAKARAIKREEEKKRKQQQREEEKRKKAAEETEIDVTAPRASRRRSTMGPSVSGSATPVNAGMEDGDGGQDDPNRRRPRRRIGDSESVVGDSDPNAAEGAERADTAQPPPPVMAAEKGVVALPTAAASTQVGDHVVQTIAAQELDEHEGLDDAALREHEEVTKVKNVAFLELGQYQMETWYFSPLPKELLSEKGFVEVLYVCEFTLNMFARKTELRRFQSRLPTERRHPPGNEIYRHNNLSMFEIDGFQERIYCQNLCYIAKLFLDHKTLYYDVDPFLFYVLCEVDERGFHPVGYYSKEKYSDVGYNLACILTFPSHQRKGYGRFLIAFSYELSKKEEKVGSPEKPMSDLGQQAYKPYWASTIIDFLLNQCPDANSLSIMDISKKTSIMAEDIVFTLNQLSILKIINGVYFIAAEEGLLTTLAKKYPVKEPRVVPSKLHWTPFITEIKKDKFSIHSKKPSVESSETRGAGGFP